MTHTTNHAEPMTSPTDELRRLLDERGVKWSATTGAAGTIWTHWDAFNGHRVHAMDNEDGTVEIFGEWDVTPEQAVEATLGPLTERATKDSEKDSDERGECRRVLYKPTGVLVCSECGAGIPKQLDKYCYLHYCPNCGRKIKED